MKYLKNILIILIVSMVFLNLNVYASMAGLLPFPAYITNFLMFIVLLMYYFFTKYFIKAIKVNRMFMLWIAYYFTVSTIYFIVSPMNSIELTSYKTLIMMMFGVFTAFLLSGLDNKNLIFIRKVLVVISILAMLMLGIDFFNPGYFFTGTNIYYEAGRGAGTYINSNIAGGALLIMMILTIDIVPRRLRFVFLIIIFLGIFFTLSRSNLLIFFILLFLFSYQKKINYIYVILSFSVIFFLFTWLVNGGFDYLSKEYDLEVTNNMINRVAFFDSKVKADTNDMDERKIVLRAALEMFFDKPLFGNGYTSTRVWEYRVAPHNTYVSHWADYGLFGLLILPLLYFSLLYKARRLRDLQNRQLIIAFVVYFVIASAFSHNMLEQNLKIFSIVFLIMLKEVEYDNTNKIKKVSLK